jgi:urea transport system ATP-binding protein
VLSIEDLTVSFDGFKAIDALNLYVDKGELRVIIGPNGAGKTTVLDLICGKTKASAAASGSRTTQEMTKLPNTRSCAPGIGRKFQTPVDLREPEVFKNLEVSFPRGGACSARWRSSAPTEVRARVDEVAGEIGLATPDRGRTAVPRPEAVAGDRHAADAGPRAADARRADRRHERARARADRRAAQRICQNRSMIVIEHDMEFVKRIAHKVTVMHQGKILAEGPMERCRPIPRSSTCIWDTERAKLQ